MKHTAKTIILVVFLAVLTATLMPAQVFADSLPEYISEVKVFYGSYKNAEADGFTVLIGDNGKPVDLNKNAGGNLGSKGERAVYLGYKTTSNRNEAITDLALMNMKGGYSVADYEALMELQMSSQIIPFVESFQVTIDEYRQNYNSDNENNSKRAHFIHDMLNKLTDDDSGGTGLGDLLLNETKFEMGDEAYEALSESEKKQHADLVTIVAQANGQATLLMNNLLTRASDTNDNTWVDRFVGMTYDDMVDATGNLPTDARKELARLYDDDANMLLDVWDDLREELEEYETASEKIDEAEAFDYDAYEEKYENFDAEKASSDEVLDALIDMTEERYETTRTIENLSIVAIHDYLDSIEYGDGTLLDFFMQSEEDVADDITMLYPMIASFTLGQRAGMEFVSLKELILMTLNDEQGIEDEELEKLETVSIYEGVDRAVYQKGGVALTSDALRKDALSKTEEGTFPHLSVLTKIMIGISAVAVVNAVASIIARGVIFSRALPTMDASVMSAVNSLRASIAANQVTLTQLGNQINNAHYLTGGMDIFTFNSSGATGWIRTSAQIPEQVAQATNEFMAVRNSIEQGEKAIQQLESSYQSARQAALTTRATVNKLMVGMTVAMVIIAAVTTYLAWRDMQNYYKVDFTAIPRYMVDEKDLMGYNSRGEKIVLKNQEAYYKAVESNAKKGDFKFNEIENLADMNGCVGKEWLALYFAKNRNMDPILASSLKVVVKSSEVPSGYTTGIHMFGSEAAFNLNSNLYDWNNSAPDVYVYFKTDDSVTKTSGSTFSGGFLALAGGAGLVIGSVASALGTTVTKKKKKEI